MAKEEQLSILRQGVEVWNQWRQDNPETKIDLSQAFLMSLDLTRAALAGADFTFSNLTLSGLKNADLRRCQIVNAVVWGASFRLADLGKAALSGSNFKQVDFSKANLYKASLHSSILNEVNLTRSNFYKVHIGNTVISDVDLRPVTGLERVVHDSPSSIATNVFVRSRGKIPELFLRGCGLSDWEIEQVKLYDPDLTNEERSKILYRVYDLQASRAVQISPLFISYSHADSEFVDKLGDRLQKKGIRYWRDIHDMSAGRIEAQIDRAIRQNPTVVLVLSQHSLSSDWVEHEVRLARGVEKETGRDVLCPVALDSSWKSSRWPARIMEQIMEYNILDFSEWQDDGKLDRMFRKLIDGLELFYKG